MKTARGLLFLALSAAGCRLGLPADEVTGGDMAVGDTSDSGAGGGDLAGVHGSKPDLATAPDGATPLPPPVSFDVAPTIATGHQPSAAITRADSSTATATSTSSSSPPPTTPSPVHLGKGDGTFKPAANYATGSSPVSVDVGDVDGDNKPDIAVGDSTGVSIL